MNAGGFLVSVLGQAVDVVGPLLLDFYAASWAGILGTNKPKMYKTKGVSMSAAEECI